MSLLFDRSNSEACAGSPASALAPPDLPISVTCWVYVETQPGDGETHTVWWFGRDGIDTQFVKLAFEADLGAHAAAGCQRDASRPHEPAWAPAVSFRLAAGSKLR